MKLVSVQCHEVVVPIHEGRVNSAEYGPAVFDETPKIILEAQTDQGIVGLGETPRGVSEATVRTALGRLAGVDLERVCFQEPPLLDLSANDMFAHEHPQRPNRLTERFFGNLSDWGVHALLLDLLGKKLGVPVHVLLGGAYRDRVKVDYWMGRMTPADSARVCRAAKKLGYRGVKCKCALEDDNVERAEAVRDVCGVDFKMTFDANMRFYRPGEALPMLRRLAAVGNIGCVEDPFPRDHLDWFRLLRDQGIVPVALHTGYNATFLEAVRLGACDFVNLTDLPWNVRAAGSVAWLAGLPSWHGSGVDLGILEALCVHVCAATKSMTRPSDIFGRALRQHNLITDALPVADGAVAVPQGPGLGVELDRTPLDRYTKRRFIVKLA